MAETLPDHELRCWIVSAPSFSAAPRRGLISQRFRAVELAQLAIKCAERQVARLACNFQDHAIREAEAGTLPVASQGGLHDFGILHDQIAVTEQHFDRLRNLHMRKAVDRIEYPGGLDQYQV